MNISLMLPDGMTKEDLFKLLQERVLVRRAQAIANQVKAARAAAAIGQCASRGTDGSLQALPVANIAPDYYFHRLYEEQEHNAERRASGENVWHDPEFLPWEMKRNAALAAPVVPASRVSLAGLEAFPRNIREHKTYEQHVDQQS